MQPSDRITGGPPESTMSPRKGMHWVQGSYAHVVSMLYRRSDLGLLPTGITVQNMDRREWRTHRILWGRVGKTVAWSPADRITGCP